MLAEVGDSARLAIRHQGQITPMRRLNGVAALSFSLEDSPGRCASADELLTGISLARIDQQIGRTLR